MAGYRKRNYKRKYTRKAKATKKTKSNRKLATRGYVKKIMHKEVENKYFTRFTTSQVAKIQCNTAPVLDEGFFNLIPAISLGNSSSSRIGNKCRVTRAKLNMTFTLAPYVAVTNPYGPGVWVKIWIFKFKVANDRAPTLSEFQSWFKGNGNNVAFQGNPHYDLNAQISDDIFEPLKTKTLFLSSSSNSANGIPNATSYMFQTGRNTVSCSFDITKYLGLLTYNDAGTGSVLGKNLWCLVQPLYSQYNVATGNAFTPITFGYCENISYEDA